jgi:hypothetical protein
MPGVKKGTITAPASTGNQSYTGLGFQPTCVIFWATAQTASGYVAGAQFSIGWLAGNGTGGHAQGIASSDNVSPCDCARNPVNTNCINLINAASGSLLAAAGVSWDADGFTLNWTNTTSGYIVHYLAFGPTMISNSYATAIQPRIGTGNQNITGVGFQGDVVFAIGAKTLINVADGSASMLHLGAVASATQLGCIAFRENDGQNPTLPKTLVRTDAVISHMSGGYSQEGLADFGSWGSDGFSLDWTGTAPDSSTHFLCLVMKHATGADIWVGSDTTKTSTGTKAKTGVGFQPKALMLFGQPAAGDNTAPTQNDSGVGIGASDGTTQGFAHYAVKESASPTDTDSRTVTSAIYAIEEVPGSSTTTSEATLSSFDADGFTLNYGTADATARTIIAIAFKDNESTGQTILPDADTVTTGWTTTPLFSKVNDASDATVITATSS